MNATQVAGGTPAGMTAPPPRGWALLRAALTNRKIGIMLIFGFASGLPYVLLLGTLYAWLGEASVDLETMGVFSLIGLAYAFKFLWSPLVDRIHLPLVGHLGRRRSWLVPIQLLLSASFITLSQLDPRSALGVFSLLAGLGAFASATQDVVIDAWRVDVADEKATLEILSTVYQLGYRIAALAGGALALIMAGRIGWPTVYLIFGIAMLVPLGASLLAPDTPRPQERAVTMVPSGELNLKVRFGAMALVGMSWTWAMVTVIVFMVQSLGADPADRPDSAAFTRTMGPIIVIATVILPAIIAATLNHWRATGRHVARGDEPVRAAGGQFVQHAYNALLLPLAEIIGRLGWASILALAIILSYRFTDSVWGPFALPFYLQELHYSNDEVAIASKFFGVGMTMAGIALSAVCFATLGRMATLILGALTAALSNLLYADLALGGAGLDLFGRYSGFQALAGLFGADERFSRLLLAIAGENLAGGLAGAAFVAYLSTITSRQHSAVQYALLSSLTFLIGALGRGALGGMIETQGYARVFFFTTGLGMIAVLLCLIEAIRARRGAQTGG
jgi:PAT family beta-lactamase induction signal transducer AmpG